MIWQFRAGALLAGCALIGAVAAQEPGRVDPERAFKFADTNGDGKLSFEEYSKLALRNPALKDKQDLLKQAFNRIDTDKDGFLSFEEFKKAPMFQGAGKLGMKKGKETAESKKPSGSAESAKFSDAAPTPEQVAFFEKKIRPVLADSCYSCHSADAKKIKGGLALDTRAGLRQGGDSGAAIVPGDPAKSLLIKAIRYTEQDLQMPPGKGKKLSDSVVADFEAWVKMGAPDPRDGAAAVVKREIDVAEGRKFWAYQPPKKASAPSVGDTGWAKGEIDRFLLAGLEAKGLKPVADADPLVLLRRLYLDLTGLPPSPTAADAFADAYAKNADAAVAAEADRLLAQPQFGERWGRHWLDVARFAESTGKAVNFNYPHAWRYRDYVIDSYNADVPFDRFVKEQLAGDLLPAKDDKERARHTVATGFLAIGPKILNERNRVQFELDVVDEQIDATTQAFLGTTAACARCHDHKFDPIPTKDYYALAGIFRSTETCYGTIRLIQANHPSPLIPLPASEPAGQKPLGADERQSIEKRIKDLQAEVAKTEYVSMAGLRARIQLGLLEAKLGMYDKDGTPKKLAMGAREKSRPADSPVYARGEPEKPGEIVHRGVLSVVGTAPAIKSGSGRRELADWIASKDNPLTARVYVNRVWLHLFGRGLVPTPDNFGTTGLPPANPALLDELAINFTNDGWSTKKLIRSIVTSHAYRLSTRFDEKNAEVDPDNALVWRMTPARLDAEVVRDSMLAVSGRLQIGHPSESPVARAAEGYANPNRSAGAAAYGMGGGGPPDDTHRSVYLPIVRDKLPEALNLFDAADPNAVVGERMNTTVPAQALFLLNGSFVIKQSEAAAEKLLASASTDSERARTAYRLFYGRMPNDGELESAEKFVQSYSKAKTAKAAWTAVAQAMFGSAEFLMRN